MANLNRDGILAILSSLTSESGFPGYVRVNELTEVLDAVISASIPKILTVRLAIANLTVTKEDVVLVNCTTSDGTGVAVTLPVSPVDGQVIVVKRIDANGGTDDVTVTDGGDLSEVITTQYSRVLFTYSSDDSAWTVGTPVTDSDAAYQLDTEAGIVIADNDGAVDLTLTLPVVASSEGRRIVVKAVDAGSSVIIDGSGAETVDGGANIDLTTDLNYADVVCDGYVWHVLDVKIG